MKSAPERPAPDRRSRRFRLRRSQAVAVRSCMSALRRGGRSFALHGQDHPHGAAAWNCRVCLRKPFTARMGTVFESSHVPLHVWLQVMYLVCSSKKGISTRQIQRTIGGSMKTAWFLGHRIREAMADDTAIMGGGGGVIEADETFLGHAPNLFVNKKGWVGGSGEKKNPHRRRAQGPGALHQLSEACARMRSCAAWT